MPAVIEQLPLVRLSDGGCTATLEIPQASACELVTEDALVGLVRERGVFIDRAVDAAIRALATRHTSRVASLSADAPATSATNATNDAGPTIGVIAHSTAAIDGTAAYIEWHAAFAPEEAEVDASTTAHVDQYNRIKRTKVACGDVLGIVHPPGEGVDGHDVCGRILAARRGNKLALQPAGSVQVEGDGSIRALKDGVLSLARLKIAVLDSFEVHGAVDFSTGNIDFVGSVKVGDGVRDNFQLKATGDVHIRGLVEAADLIVGGECVCERGVAARGIGHLFVDGGVKAAYLNGVRGRVRATVELDREMVGCDLVVGGDLRVARGSIVGGTVVVGGAVHANALGTEGGAKTVLRLGSCPFELAKAAKLAELSKKLSKEIVPLEARQDEITFRGSKATAAEKESLTELAFEIAEARRRLRLIGQERTQLLQAAGELRTVHVEVAKAIHAGTMFLVGMREVRFTSTVKGPVVITWDDCRNLQFRVGSGPVCELSDIASVREVAA